MDKSDEEYGGPERRQEPNADLRAEYDEILNKITDTPKLTEGDMNQVRDLMRNYYRRGLGSHSVDLIRLVKEEHALELSPAMLALLDNVLGLG